MSKGINQCRKLIKPGIWEDANGHLHYSIPDLLAVAGLENTPENHQAVKEMLVDLLKENGHEAPIIFRKSPNDPGEDISK